MKQNFNWFRSKAEKKIKRLCTMRIHSMVMLTKAYNVIQPKITNLTPAPQLNLQHEVVSSF